MANTRTQYLLVPHETTFLALEKHISAHFQIKAEGTATAAITFFDTFDWRLFNNKMSLTKTGNQFKLQNYPDDTLILSEPWPKKTMPAFWWDFPEGSTIRQSLRAALDVRALMPALILYQKFKTIRILNSDEKTILRLRLEHNEHQPPQGLKLVSQTVKVVPVRGYENELEAFTRQMHGLNLRPIQKHILEVALANAAKKPGDYSSKLNLQMTAEQTAEIAAKTIFRHLLQTIRQNEAGIKADIDSEFLHDFRVAVRRTRSALSQIKNVIPADITKKFQADFAYLGEITGRLRDLDVYLLKEESYLAMLPEPLQPGLKPMFANLRRERKRAQKKLSKNLSSERYDRILDDWASYLNNAENRADEKPANATTSIHSLSRKVIHRRYLRILKNGRKLQADSPNADFHSLRIQCKKLRYSLEFFRSLYPEEQMAMLIKQLKGLQDNLGDFNDLSVQQQDLQAVLERVNVSSPKSRLMASAIGGLLAVLYQQQRRIKTQFSKSFRQFNTKQNLNIFKHLFG